MKLGYSTWGMPTVEMDEAVPHLAGLGYDGIEITVIPGYTTELGTLDTEERRRIRGLFERHGQLERRLPAELDNDAMRPFALHNTQHIFQRQRLEIQLV